MATQQAASPSTSPLDLSSSSPNSGTEEPDHSDLRKRRRSPPVQQTPHKRSKQASKEQASDLQLPPPKDTEEQWQQQSALDPEEQPKVDESILRSPAQEVKTQVPPIPAIAFSPPHVSCFDILFEIGRLALKRHRGIVVTAEGTFAIEYMPIGPLPGIFNTTWSMREYAAPRLHAVRDTIYRVEYQLDQHIQELQSTSLPKLTREVTFISDDSMPFGLVVKVLVSDCPRLYALAHLIWTFVDPQNRWLHNADLVTLAELQRRKQKALHPQRLLVAFEDVDAVDVITFASNASQRDVLETLEDFNRRARAADLPDLHTLSRWLVLRIMHLNENPSVPSSFIGYSSEIAAYWDITRHAARQLGRGYNVSVYRALVQAQSNRRVGVHHLP